MNALIIDIRDTCLRVVLSNDGILEYCRTFDFEPTESLSEAEAEQVSPVPLKHAPAGDNPYLIYFDTEKKNPWDLALKQIINQIRSDIKGTIDSTHLIIPSDEVSIANHQLPKMPRADVQKLIGRKICAESKEQFPPFSILPGASDQKTQTWCSLYIPTITLRDYHKAFSSCRLRLSSITTPVNAMIDAFRSVREAIFNTHAIFEIQRGFIEAYFISADGILHFERLPYASSSNQENSTEEVERAHKQKIFKILNTIFSINSHYQTGHPATPVQMAWLCGLESGLNDIATALKEAMGIEVGIAPVIPTGLPDESGYVPLAGFAAALNNKSATTYVPADFFRRFTLRRTSGTIIYAVTACAALLAITLTEMEYRNLSKQLKQVQQSTDPKLSKNKPATSTAYTMSLDSLKKLTSRQFVFYNLFRELANDLPDGVYLENFEFHLKEDKGLIDITALTSIDDKVAESMLLSKLIKMFDSSATLRNHREPAITAFIKDNERFLKISVTSEVNPLDTTK
ncbi:MAG: hypothetical protein WCI45_04140 [Desulfuromonadales bacterium]